jgi:hypothetical protein
MKKSIADATATLKATPEDRFAKTLSPWMSVIEHAAEHYGQLVVYYRNNGLVPPESRPKKLKLSPLDAQQMCFHGRVV